MIRAVVLAVALSAAPVFVLAQDVPAVPATEQAATPTEAEVEVFVAFMAFSMRLEDMGEEMRAAVAAAAGNKAKQDADLDAIEARYKPDVDALVHAIEVFGKKQAEVLTGPERDEMLAGLEVSRTEVQTVLLGRVRAQIEGEAAGTPPPVS